MNTVEVWRARHHRAVLEDRVVGIWQHELDDVFGPQFRSIVVVPPSSALLLGKLAIIMDAPPEVEDE